MKKKTASGFEFEVDDNVLDDMRLIDMLAALMDDDTPEFQKVVAMPKLLTFILGVEQKNALYKMIADEYGGRVPVEKVSAALGEILTAQNAGN
ncbi:MAG: hypothetical protein MJY89_07640 [Bacteroidales bacterium]|nr:hypothetical protein [Bacteroidales bacterium]